MMPKQILLDTLDATVDGLTNVILRNCTTMWSLVPEAYYDEAVSRVLPGEENAEMRRQVEVYHRAQVNRFANIEKMRAAGAEVFDIVDYDYQLYCLVPSYDKSNADGIIHAESTSMGAKFAKIGETLGEDYVQQALTARTRRTIISRPTALLMRRSVCSRTTHSISRVRITKRPARTML